MISRIDDIEFFLSLKCFLFNEVFTFKIVEICRSRKTQLHRSVAQRVNISRVTSSFTVSSLFVTRRAIQTVTTTVVNTVVTICPMLTLYINALQLFFLKEHYVVFPFIIYRLELNANTSEIRIFDKHNILRLLCIYSYVKTLIQILYLIIFLGQFCRVRYKHKQEQLIQQSKYNWYLFTACSLCYYQNLKVNTLC